MKSILKYTILSIMLTSVAMPVVALDFDKALERTSNLPKKAPVDAGSSSGLVGKSDDLHRQFMKQDDSDIARARANRVVTPTTESCSYGSTKNCFDVIESSNSGKRVKIVCKKGDSLKIGKEYEICRNDNGKWMSRCVIIESLAQVYDFNAAGNAACR